MTTHRSTPLRRIIHKRRRTLVRRIIDALLRGKADEDTAATLMDAATKRGAK
jgi:hypothetical protein